MRMVIVVIASATIRQLIAIRKNVFVVVGKRIVVVLGVIVYMNFSVCKPGYSWCQV